VNQPRSTLKAKKILIIEDHDDTRSLLEWTFQSLGATTLTATNTDEAYRQVFTHRPDLIVCDIGLPGETGFQFIDWLRGHPPFRSTPCVAITAYTQVFPQRRATAFDAYVPKPLDIGRLCTAVVELVERPSEGVI
jgi:CheY-like chemotaxis protein